MINTDCTKVCCTCKVGKDKSEFSRNRARPDRLSVRCKACTKAYDKKYYSDNKDRMLAASRKRYQSDPESYKARARKWEQENPDRKRGLKAKYREKYRDKIKEISRNDWEKHKEKRKQAKREYRKNNPERGAEHCRARQTRKQQAMPVWANREAIREIYAECRRLSEITGVKHHVDHFYPLKGRDVCGLHNEYNLRVIPAVENQSKGNSTPQ